MSNKTVEHYLRISTSEHADERDQSLTWLIDHPVLSRPALIKIVREGKYEQRILGAIYVLGKIGDEADVLLLKTLLIKDDSKFFWESAQALGSHKSPAALEVLLKALHHNNTEIVGAAVAALGIRGDETARKPIEQLLEHPNESVRYRVVYALAKIGITPSINALRMHYKNETSAEVRQLIDEVLK